MDDILKNKLKFLIIAISIYEVYMSLCFKPIVINMHVIDSIFIYTILLQWGCIFLEQPYNVFVYIWSRF